MSLKFLLSSNQKLYTHCTEMMFSIFKNFGHLFENILINLSVGKKKTIQIFQSLCAHLFLYSQAVNFTYATGLNKMYHSKERKAVAAGERVVIPEWNRRRQKGVRVKEELPEDSCSEPWESLKEIRNHSRSFCPTT